MRGKAAQTSKACTIITSHKNKVVGKHRRCTTNNREREKKYSPMWKIILYKVSRKFWRVRSWLKQNDNLYKSAFVFELCTYLGKSYYPDHSHFCIPNHPSIFFESILNVVAFNASLSLSRFKIKRDMMHFRLFIRQFASSCQDFPLDIDSLTFRSMYCDIHHGSLCNEVVVKYGNNLSIRRCCNCPHIRTGTKYVVITLNTDNMFPDGLWLKIILFEDHISFFCSGPFLDEPRHSESLHNNSSWELEVFVC